MASMDEKELVEKADETGGEKELVEKVPKKPKAEKRSRGSSHMMMRWLSR